MSRVRELGVWWDGARVATLRSPRIGKITLTYAEDVLTRHPANVPFLSCSLPVGRQPLDAWAFVSGLLPEGQHRQAMAALAGVPSHDVLGMLARFGRDVAGAPVVARVEVELRRPTVVPYTEDTLADEVRGLPDHPLGLHDDSELSVAGIQDKVLLVALPDGGWGRPVHGAPSTHLLKVEDPRFPGLAAAEDACLRLASAAGLPAAESAVLHVAGRPALLVRRFDRVLTDGEVRRVHQEDVCQALGVDPEGNGRRAKYERYGGPSLSDVARLLDRWGEDPEEQLLALVDRVVLTLVIGDADAHAKNIGLLHRRPGAVCLAPLYDTVPTVRWPQLRTEAAQAVGGCWSLDTASVDDLVRETRGWGLPSARVLERATSLLARLRAALPVVQDPGVRDVIAGRLDRLAP